MNFFGIDEEKIAGMNCLVVTVLAILMVLKNLLRVTLKAIRAIFRHSKKNIFNAMEIIVIFCLSRIIFFSLQNHYAAAVVLDSLEQTDYQDLIG